MTQSYEAFSSTSESSSGGGGFCQRPETRIACQVVCRRRGAKGACTGPSLQHTADASLLVQ